MQRDSGAVRRVDFGNPGPIGCEAGSGAGKRCGDFGSLAADVMLDATAKGHKDGPLGNGQKQSVSAVKKGLTKGVLRAIIHRHLRVQPNIAEWSSWKLIGLITRRS